ncbi:flagellar protein FlaG [Candidatus Omnitrophota bacterium]
MKIESRVQDMTLEIRKKEFQDNAASRQRSVTSGLSNDDSTREPIISKRVSNERVARKSASIPDPIDVQKAVEKLNTIAESQRKNITFSVDEKSDSTVIKVFKTQTGELIKQFPPEEILAMRAKVRSNTNWFFDRKM